MPDDKRKKMEAAAAAIKKLSRSYEESLKKHAVLRPPKLKKKKVGKLRRTVKELIGGSKTYLPKKSTARSLKEAGVDWEKDKPSARLKWRKK